jgi:uncharacterized protein YbaR (Trm112 family)
MGESPNNNININGESLNLVACPYCNRQLVPRWLEYYSCTKQRLTKQRLWYCDTHNKLFQIFGGKMVDLFPNSKVYSSPELAFHDYLSIPFKESNEYIR